MSLFLRSNISNLCVCVFAAGIVFAPSRRRWEILQDKALIKINESTQSFWAGVMLTHEPMECDSRNINKVNRRKMGQKPHQVIWFSLLCYLCKQAMLYSAEPLLILIDFTCILDIFQFSCMIGDRGSEGLGRLGKMGRHRLVGPAAVSTTVSRIYAAPFYTKELKTEMEERQVSVRD